MIVKDISMFSSPKKQSKTIKEIVRSRLSRSKAKSNSSCSRSCSVKSSKLKKIESDLPKKKIVSKSKDRKKIKRNPEFDLQKYRKFIIKSFGK